MPFSDPSSGFFAPTIPSTGPVSTPSFRLPSLPDIANISPPSSVPFRNIEPIKYEGDKTFGTVAAGIAQLGNNSLEAVDTAIKLDIGAGLSKDVHALQQRQIQAGQDTKQDILQDEGDQDNRSSPIGLTQGLDRMGTLEKAKRYGSMSDTQFYTQMQDLVSGMKNKYPGYSEVIDGKIKEITGVDPAEALRKSYQADLTQLRQDQLAHQTRLDSFIQQNQEYFPDGWQSKSYNELRAIAAAGAARDHTIKLQRAELALKQDQGKVIADDAYGSARVQGTYGIANMVNTFVEGVGGQSAVDKLVKTGFKDANEQQTVLAGINSLEKAAHTAITALLNTSITPDTDPGNTFGKAIGSDGRQERLTKLRDELLEPINALKQSIINKDTGALGVYTRTIQSIKDMSTADVYTNNPVIPKLNAIKDAVGDNYFGYIGQQPAVAGYVTKAVLDAARYDNITSDAPLSVQTRSNVEKKFPSGNWQVFLNDKTQGILMPDAKPEAKENFARQIFLDKDPSYFLQKVAGAGNAMDAFNRLASPEIAAEIKKMKPEIQTGYNNWVLTNFANVYSRIGDEINSNAVASPYYDIKLNAASGQFEVVPTVQGMRLGAKYQESVPSTTITAVNKLNAGINTVKPVLEQSGQDVPTYLSTLQQGMQLSPDQLKKGGLWYGMEVNRIAAKDRYNKQKSQEDVNVSPEVTTVPTPDNTSGTNTDTLKKLIFSGESSNNPNAMHPEMGKLYGKDVNLTDKTIDQVLTMQKDAQGQGASSTAVGQGQFIYKTLKGLVSELGLKGDQKFTPELQHKLTDALLERRGLTDYKSGKIDKYQFADNLSQEWAALPGSSGLGYYDGKNGNKASVKLPDLLKSIEGIGRNSPAMDSAAHAAWRESGLY